MAEGFYGKVDLFSPRYTDPLLENMRRASLTYDLRTNPDLVGYSFVGADETARLNPSGFTLLGFNGEWGRKREDEQTDLAVDVNQNFSWWWIDGLQYGGKYTIRENYENNRRITASAAQLAPLWGGGPAPNLFLREVSPSSGQFLDAEGGTSGLFHQSWLVNDPFAFIKAYGRKAIQATPLQGALKNNYTASMYYEKGWFGGRVSYTWRDDFYTGIEGNTQDTRIQQDFGTPDANISFNNGRRILVGLRGSF